MAENTRSKHQQEAINRQVEAHKEEIHQIKSQLG